MSDNLNYLYIQLKGFTNGQFNINKEYKLVFSDEVSERFSCNIKGNILNSLTSISNNYIAFELFRADAFEADNTDSATGYWAGYSFEREIGGVFTYYDLTDINQVPTYLTNLDASGFLTSDFPVIDVNTNKINISLTEI